MRTLMLIVLIGVVGVLLFGCVAGPSALLPSNLNVQKNNTVANTNTTTTPANNATVSNTSANLDPVSACLAKYGLEGVVFIHADWCPHCQKMKPWVQQLQSEGYKAVMANSDDKTTLGYVSECLSGVAQMKYIPEFVCPANKEDHVGEFTSIDEMRAFFDRCKS